MATVCTFCWVLARSFTYCCFMHPHQRIGNFHFCKACMHRSPTPLPAPSINNDDRPDEAFTTERAQRAGRANAASGAPCSPAGERAHLGGSAGSTFLLASRLQLTQRDSSSASSKSTAAKRLPRYLAHAWPAMQSLHRRRSHPAALLTACAPSWLAPPHPGRAHHGQHPQRPLWPHPG